MYQIKKLTSFFQLTKFLVIIFAFIFFSSTHLLAQNTMQSWTGCRDLATPTGTNFTQGPILTDERDGKQYEIRKFADGRCWMVDNLMYGGTTDACVGKTTFNGNGSATPSNQFGTGTFGDCRDPRVGGSAPCTAGSTTCGYYYNWQAAMQHASAYYNTTYTGPTELVQGLCPAGWRLPTSNTDGDFEVLHLAAGSPTTGFWQTPGNWKGDYSGMCDEFGGLGQQNVYGGWWTNTASSTTHSYRMGFYSSGIYINDPGYKNYGLLVRCLKNYEGETPYQITDDGKEYEVVTFLESGTFHKPDGVDEVDVLVVAGGGAGSGGAHTSGSGGGGGAGGLIYEEQYSVSGVHQIIVGNGGYGSSLYSQTIYNGENSKFDDLEAVGGGKAGTWVGSGFAGGSGGGAGGWGSPGGSYVVNQGHSGSSSNDRNGGSGGGAGEAALWNKGGDGLYFGDKFGTNIGENGWFAGGGVSGRHWSGVFQAGLGGGGDSSTRINGLSNTGGGGGGGNTGDTLGGNGGSGIVIVRYEISAFNLNIDDASTDITPTKSSPNFTISGTIDYPEDGDATSVAVSATIGGINRNVTVPVSTNMTWQLSWNYNDLSEGEYTNIEFTSTSNSATPEETTSTYTGKIIIDKTAPTCGSWSPTASPWKVSGGETFTLTSSSDIGGSGLATASASVSCSTGPIHGDTCPVTIFDKAGNDQICSSPINRVDIFSPTLTVTPAITGWQGDKQNIIVTSFDEETSLSRIAYAWDLNTLGSDCSGGTTISSGDNLRLTISGGANPLYVCSIDLAGNVSTFTNIYQYIPPVFANPTVDKNVKPANLYWNIQSVSETQSYVEIKGFFPKTTGSYNYALEYIIPTINKSFTQALCTSPFTETHFTFLIPTADFQASKDNHTFSGPQKLKITDLDQMEATTIDHNLSFFFPIHQTNHRTSFNYFIFASDNRLNEVGE